MCKPIKKISGVHAQIIKYAKGWYLQQGDLIDLKTIMAKWAGVETDDISFMDVVSMLHNIARFFPDNHNENYFLDFVDLLNSDTVINKDTLKRFKYLGGYEKKKYLIIYYLLKKIRYARVEGEHYRFEIADPEYDLLPRATDLRPVKKFFSGFNIEASGDDPGRLFGLKKTEQLIIHFCIYYEKEANTWDVEEWEKEQRRRLNSYIEQMDGTPPVLYGSTKALYNSKSDYHTFLVVHRSDGLCSWMDEYELEERMS